MSQTYALEWVFELTVCPGCSAEARVEYTGTNGFLRSAAALTAEIPLLHFFFLELEHNEGDRDFFLFWEDAIFGLRCHEREAVTDGDIL